MPSNATSLRLLWIATKYPLGAPDGARHATCVLLRNLSRLGVKIDLICLLPHGEEVDPEAARKQLGVSSCIGIARSGSLFKPFPRLNIPLTFRTFADPQVTEALRRELTRLLKFPNGSRSHTFTLFDGLHTLAPLSPPYLKDLLGETPLIYRAHNVESLLWEQCAEKTRKKPWLHWLYRHQAALVRYFEGAMARTVSWVAPVSQEDAIRFRQLSPGANVSSVPIGVDFPSETAVHPVALGLGGLDVLFIGRLDWLPNKKGLQWLLDHVWPDAYKKRPSLTLKIAGVGDGRWLKKYRGLPGVEFLGKVDQVAPFYEACSLAIAPIFQGSGTRVKILESARYARPVLSTALGAEGSGLVPGVSYFRAEDQKDWRMMLDTLTRRECRSAGWKAFEESRERLDGKAVALRFMQTLETLLPQPQEPSAVCPL